MKQLRVFLTFLVLTFCCTGIAHAITVFDNFGPGDTYNTTVGWNVTGPTSQAGAEQESAMSFMPSATGDLSTIDFVISLVTGTNDVALSLVNDSGGAPLGALLESWTFTDQMGYFGTVAPILTADSVLHPLLQAGITYWLVASPPATDTWAAWNFNSIGDTVAGTVSVSFDEGVNWVPQQVPTRGVFRVNSTAVPEPSTVILLGAGLAGVGLLRRRFKN